MSGRDAIRMSETEVQAFLAEEKTVVVGTIGRDGWPHLMPLWYVVTSPRGGACDAGRAKSDPERIALWSWTYAASQKVRNLERDPRCTLQVESGTEYGELRGVMFKAECALHRDVEAVAGIGAELAQRYGGEDLSPELEAAMRKQASKRVGLEFVSREASSWDHRKLGGTY
jgi:hypothetical protein